ncbi:MAG: hypothetical protein Q7S02_06570 [bacterium]|nr:hypothetical protein [bacterium]
MPFTGWKQIPKRQVVGEIWKMQAARSYASAAKRVNGLSHRVNDEDGRLTCDTAHGADHQAEKSGSTR